MAAAKGNKYAVGADSGRPSKYTKELGEEICKRLASGESLLRICKDNKMPNRSTIYEWLIEGVNKEFSNNYKKANDLRTEHLFDELEEIAERGCDEVQRDRLRVDTRKWYLSKVLPKKYGDKIDHTTNGKDMPMPIISLNAVPTDNSD